MQVGRVGHVGTSKTSQDRSSVGKPDVIGNRNLLRVAIGLSDGPLGHTFCTR